MVDLRARVNAATEIADAEGEAQLRADEDLEVDEELEEEVPNASFFMKH